MNESVSKTIARAVVSEVNAKLSGKSRGTKIAVNQRVIPIKIIEPFSK